MRLKYSDMPGVRSERGREGQEKGAGASGSGKGPGRGRGPQFLGAINAGERRVGWVCPCVRACAFVWERRHERRVIPGGRKGKEKTRGEGELV